MKKMVRRTVNFCDACGKETDYPAKCLGCGVEYCYDCQNKLMTEYQHAVNFRGGDDGNFCLKCDSDIVPKARDLLYAYLDIKELIAEEVTWYENFKMRSEKAEARVKQERRKLRLK